MRFSCGQLLVKCVIEVKRVALSMKFGSIVNLCDACNYKDVSSDRRRGQLFLNGRAVLIKSMIDVSLGHWQIDSRSMSLTKHRFVPINRSVFFPAINRCLDCQK